LTLALDHAAIGIGNVNGLITWNSVARTWGKKQRKESGIIDLFLF
jgi:hypothetical protein